MAKKTKTAATGKLIATNRIEHGINPSKGAEIGENPRVNRVVVVEEGDEIVRENFPDMEDEDFDAWTAALVRTGAAEFA